MIFLKILGIIFAVILLTLFFILMCPVTVNVKTDENKKIKFNVKFLFININNQKEKAKKTVSESPKKDNLFKTYLEKYGFTDTVSKIFELLSDALKELSFILKKAKFKKVYLTIITATDDASKTAISYGTICSVVYPVTAYMDNELKVSKNAFDINIGCDFNTNKPDYSFEIEVSLKSFSAVISAIKLFRKYKKLF
jgi:hypothetical protein